MAIPFRSSLLAQSDLRLHRLMELSGVDSWFVAHVESTCTKTYVRLLLEQGFCGWTPITRVVRRYSNRTKRESEVALFPGYLFAAGVGARLWLKHQRKGVFGILEDVIQDRLKSDMLMISRAIEVDPYLRSSRVPVDGDLVRIPSGPFMGYRGYVLKSNPRRVVVVIETLGSAIETDFATGEVELCEDGDR